MRNRKMWVISAISALFAVLIVSSIVLAARYVFAPNYEITFKATGDCQAIFAQPVKMQADKNLTLINSNVQKEDVPLTFMFGSDYFGDTSSPLYFVADPETPKYGYLSLQRSNRTSNRMTFYFTFQTGGHYLHLRGSGAFLGNNTTGWFTFTSDSPFILLDVSGPTQVQVGNPTPLCFTIDGTKLP